VARFVRAVALFALLTVVMTWPQAPRLATAAEEHQDVFFNMWRFAWVAHAISTAPFHILDGNIFYPEPLAFELLGVRRREESREEKPGGSL